MFFNVALKEGLSLVTCSFVLNHEGQFFFSNVISKGERFVCIEPWRVVFLSVVLLLKEWQSGESSFTVNHTRKGFFFLNEKIVYTEPWGAFQRGLKTGVVFGDRLVYMELWRIEFFNLDLKKGSLCWEVHYTEPLRAGFFRVVWNSRGVVVGRRFVYIVLWKT